MNDGIHGTQLNFDEWRVLAETDPEEFERRRRDVLEACIAEAPQRSQVHLRRLQWRIDMERRYHWRSPLVATRRIFNLMWNSVYAEGGLLPSLQRLTDTATEATHTPLSSATVLRFKTGATKRP